MVGRGCPDLIHLFIIDCIQMCDTGLKVKIDIYIFLSDKENYRYQIKTYCCMHVFAIFEQV